MIPLQISYRDFSASEAVSAAIEKRAEKLERFASKIDSCHVVVSSPHKHHLHGKIFHVQIQLHLPGEHIAINRETEKDASHEDVYVAIRDAFETLERKLKSHSDIKKDENRRKSAKAKKTLRTQISE